eukprot:TRINITY_DN1398_c0_g1_i15.p1 TRINITY_DN1398_c0_g1~~TRINITY_DN1398_c0_g1_i15.p1  ORF type:complete len:138 (-),score=4.16 TRINITY_DN1398_c0_g1_i15:64-477(-)
MQPMLLRVKRALALWLGMSGRREGGSICMECQHRALSAVLNRRYDVHLQSEGYARLGYLEIQAFAASISSLRKGKAEVALSNYLLTNAASLSPNSPNHDCLAQPRSPVETTDATLSPMWKQPPQPDQTYPPTLLWSL